MPALGISLILITFGAILAFAVNASVEGIAIEAVGLILMSVGFLGLLLSLLFLLSFSPFARTETHHSHVDSHVD